MPLPKIKFKVAEKEVPSDVFRNTWFPNRSIPKPPKMETKRL